MTLTLILLIFVIIAALIFEYVNGFHDAANAIATVVSTKTLTPKQAVLFGATLEFTGALLGTHVAKTIGGGIVEATSITQAVILCALIAAIIWNLLTWYYGLPSSSSHALIGGLIGASISHAGISVVKISGIIHKVIYPMLTSPLIGFSLGLIVMVILLKIFYKFTPDKVNKIFRKGQLFSSGAIALSHGMNDAQKTMGIITLALVSAGYLPEFEVPLWVILVCAITMSMGIMSGGWKIIRTMGSKIIKLKPIHGFAAESAAAAVIITASNLGLPLSTTHVISTSIMGVGSIKRFSAVKWGVVKSIIMAWVLTIPITIFIGSSIYYLVRLVFHLL